MDSYDLAIKALKRGDFRAARDYFELEFKQAKKNKEMDREYKACKNLGSAYSSLGPFQKAIEFQKPQIINPKTAVKNAITNNSYTTNESTYRGPLKAKDKRKQSKNKMN